VEQKFHQIQDKEENIDNDDISFRFLKETVYIRGDEKMPKVCLPVCPS
jgi:hypothetical protein